MIEDIPRGPFSVVLADPPWAFATYSAKGEGKSPSQHYSTMDLEAICALPVQDVVAKDAVLFIWGTWPTIFQTEQVIKAWGFKFSGLAWEWVKFNQATGKFSFGCGYGTRKNLEPTLMARRGNPKLMNRSVRDFIFAPRREHSRKPDQQYDRIESMYEGPYLEMFARQSARPGWTAWGNEVGKLDEVEA